MEKHNKKATKMGITGLAVFLSGAILVGSFQLIKRRSEYTSIKGGIFYIDGLNNKKLDNFDNCSIYSDNIDGYIPQNNTMDLYEIIDNNKNIESKYIDSFKKYINLLIKKYPDIDLDVFKFNLKDLKTSTCLTDYMKDNYYGAVAFYDEKKNEIIIDASLYTEDVLFHEISHTINNCYVEIHGNMVIKTYLGFDLKTFYGRAFMEGATSSFTSIISNQEGYYMYFQKYSNIIKQMIGEDQFTKIYTNGNIDDIVNILSEYYSKEEIINIFKKMDNILESNCDDETDLFIIYDDLKELFFKKEKASLKNINNDNAEVLLTNYLKNFYLFCSNVCFIDEELKMEFDSVCYMDLAQSLNDIAMEYEIDSKIVSKIINMINDCELDKSKVKSLKY